MGGDNKEVFTTVTLGVTSAGSYKWSRRNHTSYIDKNADATEVTEEGCWHFDQPETFTGKIGSEFTLKLTDKKKKFEVAEDKKTHYAVVPNQGSPATVTYVIVKDVVAVNTSGEEQGGEPTLGIKDTALVNPPPGPAKAEAGSFFA